MKIIIVSDLHLEFKYFFLPKMEDEENIIVVLAGDIGIIKKPRTYRDFINNTSDRFKKVIWIMGNHEYYKGSMTSGLAKLWYETLDLENLYVVNNETVIFDDVAFVCSTLWTNFDNHNVMTMNEAQLWMNDYKLIRCGSKAAPYLRKLRPSDTLQEHIKAKQFIFPEILKQKEAGKKVVVVTHHLPSFLSIPEKYRADSLNGSYASELFEDIMNTQPLIVIHGHTHSSNDYMIGDTRIISNPRGYAPNDLNKEFISNLTIEI